jgi:hypothetical protein
MLDVLQLSDLDLRTAIAMGFRHPWKNVQLTGTCLTGESTFGISELAREEIPNWPGDPASAELLERAMKAYGLYSEYLHNLSELPGHGTPARRMSEAALITLRAAAA